MRTWKKLTAWSMVFVFMTAGLPLATYAQTTGGGTGGTDGGTGGTGGNVGSFPDSTSSGLPRDNVTGSAAGGRAPGNWIQSALGRIGMFHSRSIDQFGGVEYSQPPGVSRRQTFLLTFIPQAFTIINNLIQAYIAAMQGGTPTTQPAG